MSYVLAPDGLGAGDIVSTCADAAVKPGTSKPLASLPTGTIIHNIEMRPGRGGQLCRSAGTCATLIKNGDDGRTLISLPSGVHQHGMPAMCVTTKARHPNRLAWPALRDQAGRQH